MDDETTTSRTPPPLAAARLLEDRTELDGAVDTARRVVVGQLSEHPRLADVLHGRLTGHALHPELTDLPIGFWTSAFVLDLCGGDRSRDAADLLVGLGVLSTVPTALAGWADWSAQDRRVQRVGLVHVLFTQSGLLLYGASWLLRRGRRRGLGVAVSFAGAAAVTAGAYLGGHMALRQGSPAGGMAE